MVMNRISKAMTTTPNLNPLQSVLLGVLVLFVSSCGENPAQPTRSGASVASATPDRARASDRPSRAESADERAKEARDKIRNSSDSARGRLESARDMVASMSGRDAPVARAILGDMANRDLLAHSATAENGEIIITIRAGDLQVVEQAYSHLARVAPMEAALLLGEIPGEIAEELLGRWITKQTGLDEYSLREFQAGLDHDMASALPWRLAREWATTYGDDVALGYMERIAGFFPAPPADILARMRNSIAAGQ
jgi:hypothetical protein